MALFAVLILFGSLFRQTLSPFFHVLIDPLLNISHRVSELSDKIVQLFEPKSQLIAQNEALKNALLEANQSIISYPVLLAENEALKKIHQGSATSTSIVAAVLKLPDATPYDTVLIDKGKGDRVEVNDEVRLLNGTPVGVVAYSYSNTSLIKLYSSPGESYPVFIGPNKIAGTAKGLGGGNFEIILAHGAKVVKGDAVTLPGISSTPYGFVESMSEIESGTFVRVLFRNTFAFDDIRFLRILK